jgi:hypothetical protein
MSHPEKPIVICHNQKRPIVIFPFLIVGPFKIIQNLVVEFFLGLSGLQTTQQIDHYIFGGGGYTLIFYFHVIFFFQSVIFLWPDILSITILYNISLIKKVVSVCFFHQNTFFNQ